MSEILETLKFLGSSWLNVAVAVDERLEKQTARIAELEAALRRIVGTLDDPTGGQHVADMREASAIAIATLKGGEE